MLNKIKVYLFYLIGMFLLLVNMNVETLYVNFFGFLVCSKIIYTFEKQNKMMVLNEIRMKINHVKIESTKHFLY